VAVIYLWLRYDSVVKATRSGERPPRCPVTLRDRGVGTLTQADLLGQLGAPAITPDLADVLNRLSGIGLWRGAQLNAAGMGERNAVKIPSNSGSWVAELREVGARIGHAVIVDGLRNGDTLSIRDPYGGTSYRMKVDVFLTYWTWAAVWQEQP